MIVLAPFSYITFLYCICLDCMTGSHCFSNIGEKPQGYPDYDVFLCYSDTTKNVLIASTYIHLKSNGFGKYASDLPSVCPRILLSGPAGSAVIMHFFFPCKVMMKWFYSIHFLQVPKYIRKLCLRHLLSILVLGF